MSKMSEPAKRSTTPIMAKSSMAVMGDRSQYAGISCVWNPYE